MKFACLATRKISMLFENASLCAANTGLIIILNHILVADKVLQ